MGFGFVLKELLRDRGMTIKQLSENAEIPVNTLYSITKRDSVRVDPVVAARVCEAMNVSVEELLNLRPAVDTPENRDAIETGLTAFLEAADEYRKKNENKQSRKQAFLAAWKAAEEKAGKKLTFDEMKEYFIMETDIVVRLDNAIKKLNNEGRKVALERVEELTLIDKYTLPDVQKHLQQRTAPHNPAQSNLDNTDTTENKKPPEGDK